MGEIVQRLKINQVAQDKGAYGAGVQPGDVLISFCGAEIASNEDLSKVIQSSPDGGEFVVHRGSETVRLNITNLPLGIVAVPVEYDLSTYSQPGMNRGTEEDRAREAIIITTTPSIDGHHVVRIVDVIAAECVFGMNILSEVIASLTDFLGGRSGQSQRVLRDARKVCIRELREEARLVGANAVIGVSLDYSEMSGQGKSMLFLVASGTAVVLEKDAERTVS